MADPGSERAVLDLRVQDPAALEEIELYSELIILAGESAQPLTHAQIDQVLGLREHKRGGSSEGAPSTRARSG